MKLGAKYLDANTVRRTLPSVLSDYAARNVLHETHQLIALIGKNLRLILEFIVLRGIGLDPQRLQSSSQQHAKKRYYTGGGKALFIPGDPGGTELRQFHVR